MRPLRGTETLLLRPRSQAGELARRLRALGSRVTIASALRPAPPSDPSKLDRALRALEDFEALAFSSANGVEAFFGRARRLRGRVPARPRRLYAVGPATARALEARGWGGARIGPEHDGLGLARRMAREVRGLRVLLPAAEGGRQELARELARAGAKVTRAPAYRMEADRAGAAAIRDFVARSEKDPRRTRWLALASPSQLEALVETLGRARARRFLGSSKIASIGPTTTEALARMGLEPAAQAARATARDLALAISREESSVERMEAVLRLALRRAGRILLQRFGRARVTFKGRGNPVTDADHSAEEAILRSILSNFPNHDFLTEERAPKRTGSEFVWVVDPLDGTVNYSHGSPCCCVSIGLLRCGRPLLGGVFDPFRGELFLARRGRGATLNGRRIHVSRARRVSDSLLATGFPYDRQRRAGFYLGFHRAFLERCHDLRRSGSAAIDLAWVAAGRVDGFWEFVLNPWDVAAGMLLVEEAGGKVTDFDGRAWPRPEAFGKRTLASNGLIHDAMRRLLRRG